MPYHSFLKDFNSLLEFSELKYTLTHTLSHTHTYTHTHYFRSFNDRLIDHTLQPIIHNIFLDEALTTAVLGIKEGGKVEGLQAALTGAAASLVAQAVTTPVCLQLF